MFKTIKSLLTHQPKPQSPTGFLICSKHRETHEVYERTFETRSDLDGFLASYCPTAHLIYATTEVYAVTGGEKQLVEMHQHLTGNVLWEQERFRKTATALGARVEAMDVYPNQASACSTSVRLSY